MTTHTIAMNGALDGATADAVRTELDHKIRRGKLLYKLLLLFVALAVFPILFMGWRVIREGERAIQEQIIGSDVVERLYASSPADQGHIPRFLSANCFGDFYTRTGIDVPTRELLTFSMLVALGGCDPQVKGHVAANLRVGNDRGRLIDVLTQLLPFIGYPRTLNALRVVDEVTGTAGAAMAKSEGTS